MTGTANADAKLSACDISVDGGDLTFNGSVSKSGDALYTIDYVIDNKKSVSIIYSDLMIVTSSSSEYGLRIRGTFTVESGCTINTTGGTYGCRNGSELIVNGTLIATATTSLNGRGLSNDGNITVNGTITAMATGSGSCGIRDYGTMTTFVVESGGIADASGDSEGVEAVSTYGSLIINGTLTATCTESSGYGMYVQAETVVVSGTLYTVASSNSRCINTTTGGTVTTTDSGQIYKNGVLQ